MKKLLYFIALLIFLPCAAQAEGLLGIATDNGQETITLTLHKVMPRKVFLVPNPDRLVVDVPSMPGHPQVVMPAGYKGTLIKQVRFGHFDPQTSRFVFELAQPVKINDVKETGGLVISIAGGPGIEAAPPPPPEEAKAAPPLKTAKGKKPAMCPKPEKPLIVIDAGHGGVDPGTIAPDGTQEKDVVLAYAKALRDKLLSSGHYRVKLTREDDTFIMLRQRVAIARKAGGSLFVSLHADSADRSARGLSVYTLSEQASDKEAEALAARENKADVLAGVDLSDERADVADILISLAQRETKNQSATFADLLVTRLDGKVVLLPNSHRFAGFAVLKAPDIPSVLIETGFLTNPKEEKNLKSKPYREKVVAAIATGIDGYFRLQKRLGAQ